MLPLFDLRSILIKSIFDNRILLTIPWIVQYLMMLDHVTLQLKYYKELLTILFELYITLENRTMSSRATAKFIIRICLGYLFEQPGIADAYYLYRQNRNNYNLSDVINDMKALTWSPFNSSDVSSNKSDLERRKNLTRDVNSVDFNANLEEILNAACPFLADFRVSIMPSRLSKTLSRSGKYRYITTKLADTNTSIKEKTTDVQANLLGEFLQSQSQSTRKTIDFVIERTASAAIKDFQFEHFIRIKESVSKHVSGIRVNKYALVKEALLRIYRAGLEEINLKWNNEMHNKIKERVSEAINALLPKETLVDLKNLFIKYSIQKSLQKTNEWKAMYCSGLEIFSTDLDADVDKVIRSSAAVKNDDYLLNLDINSSLPSISFSNIQILISYVMCIDKKLEFPKMFKTIQDFEDCIGKQELSKVTFKIAAIQMIELAVFLICYRGSELQLIENEAFRIEFHEKFIEFFKQPKLLEFIQIPESITKDSNEEPPNDLKIFEDKISNNYIFQNFFNARLVHLIKMNGCGRDSWISLQDFLIFLIEKKLMSLNNLNDQCLLTLKQDIDSESLQHVSNLMNGVFESYAYDRTINEQTKLVTQVLSNLTNNVDF